MDQETSVIEYKHIKFVEQVVTNDAVWGLDSDEGFAISSSNEFEELEVIPFWSDKTYAQAVAQADWKDYTANFMSLSDFMENWLVGMHNDEILVGTNWDGNMTGKEIKPLELALELVEYIVANDKKISFTKYKDVKDYQESVKEALAE